MEESSIRIVDYETFYSSGDIYFTGSHTELYNNVIRLGYVLNCSLEMDLSILADLAANRMVLDDGRYKVLLFSADPSESRYSGLRLAREYCSYVLGCMVRETLDRGYLCYSGEIDGRYAALVCFFSRFDCPDTERLIAGLDGLSARIAARCDELFGVKVCVNRGFLADGIRQISMSYKAALHEELYNKFTLKHCHQESAGVTSEGDLIWLEMSDMETCARNLYLAICGNDSAQLHKTADEIIEGLIYRPPYRLQDMRRRVQLVSEWLLNSLTQDEGLVIDGGKKRSAIVSLICTEDETSFRRQAHALLDRLVEMQQSNRDQGNIIRMEHIKKYIQDNRSNVNLTVSGIADVFHMSPGTLYSQFKKKFGVSLSDFIHSIRLECAVNLLRTTDLPLKQVSELSGFGSLNTMHRSFKKYLGVTPGKMR